MRMEPCIESRRSRSAGELSEQKSGHVGRADAGERVGQRARAASPPGFANEVDAVNQYAAVM